MSSHSPEPKTGSRHIHVHIIKSFCPLLAKECIRDKCAWWTAIQVCSGKHYQKNEQCALTLAAYQLASMGGSA